MRATNFIKEAILGCGFLMLAAGTMPAQYFPNTRDDDYGYRRDRDVYRDDDYGYRRDRGVYRDDDTYRRERRRNRRAQNRGNYGDYGTYGNTGYNRGASVQRVMNDLNSVASRNYADGHERKHFDDAMKNLQKFDNAWRSGKWDQKPLDKAIESMEHLAGADQIRGRDRDMIHSDLAFLRDLRANRGGSYGYERNGPYGYIR